MSLYGEIKMDTTHQDEQLLQLNVASIQSNRSFHSKMRSITTKVWLPLFEM